MVLRQRHTKINALQFNLVDEIATQATSATQNSRAVMVRLMGTELQVHAETLGGAGAQNLKKGNMDL